MKNKIITGALTGLFLLAASTSGAAPWKHKHYRHHPFVRINRTGPLIVVKGDHDYYRHHDNHSKCYGHGCYYEHRHEWRHRR